MTATPPAAADRLLQEVIAGNLAFPPDRLGVAVSGGGDSMALLHLLADWAAESGAFTLHAATVDHGLRTEAAAEARTVAGICDGLGVAHETLRWTGWSGEGNLQDAARRARYDLLADWAARHGVTLVTVGHTADDQAETLLMRLARSSGVDGLSAMAPRWRHAGTTFVRPMLALRRADLRAHLRRRNVTWIDDPSNDDDTFDRVRARRALEALDPIGLTVPALCTVSQNLAAIRETLGFYAFTEARACVRVEQGDIVIPLTDLRRLRPEILRRILVRALMWISGAEYGPRGKTMTLLVESLRTGTGMTLHGCRALFSGGELRICREWAAVAGTSAAPGEPWDGRWRLTGPWSDGVEIRALGEAGLAECAAWRATGLPRAALLAAPAAWRGDTLVACPMAGRSDGWQAELRAGADDFYGSLLAH